MTSQADIDGILDIWLSEGSECAPAERVRSALLEITTTSQKRGTSVPRLVGSVGPTRHPVLVYAVLSAALIASLAVGLGFGAGLLHLPLPSIVPPPQPSSDARVEPSPTLMVVEGPAVDGGYRLSIPAEWVEAPDRGGVRIFRNGDGVGARIVLRTAFETAAGTLNLCLDRCASFNGIDTLEELDSALNDPSLGIDTPFGPRRPMQDAVIVRGQASIDGEPAGTIEPDISSLGGWRSPGGLYEHVFAIHDGRALVLTFDYSAVTDAQVEDTLRSFRFVVPPVSPEPSMTTGVAYRVTVPEHWMERGRSGAGTRSFALSDGKVPARIVMRIATEGADGVLVLCIARCASFTNVDAIQDLSRAIHDPSVRISPVESPYGPVMPRFPFLVREDTSLDGEPAVMEHPDPMGGGWSFLGMDEHVFAVHDGRAVVISFDYESIRRGRITEEEIASILDSFEFTDE